MSVYVVHLLRLLVYAYHECMSVHVAHLLCVFVCAHHEVSVSGLAGSRSLEKGLEI